jgi:hypothetical protein
MENFFVRTFIGALIIGFVCMVNQSAAGIVICSTILTCGLALIVWIPLAYVLGMLCTCWWQVSTEADTPTDTALKPQYIAREPQTEEDRAKIATRDYIRKQLDRGASRSEITGYLQHAGWSEEFIAKQFNHLDQTT